jgi:hypothetical protein
MKQLSPHSFNLRSRAVFIVLSLLVLGFCISSFTMKKAAEDFLEQLGISKTSADEKITNSVLGGYLDQYGLQNAKNIASGNRAAVTRDLLAYTKQYVNSAAFQKAYIQLREDNKPKPRTIQTPEEMRTGLIEQYKKSITETEANMKKADASLKNIFGPILVTLQQQLKDAEDPNNMMLANYKKNYPEMLKSIEASVHQRSVEWETKYPAHQLLFIKTRLQQFLDETSNIDFNAQLIEKNGRKYFVNPVYEHKGNRWKLAFRAGKEVVEPARAMVKSWLEEITHPRITS